MTSSYGRLLGHQLQRRLGRHAASRVRRVDSLVAGVDAAGLVVDSSDAAFRPGERVAVHGGSLGVARDGGFAEFVYAPPATSRSCPRRSPRVTP